MFKTREAQSFLDIRFCNGVLEIPHIKLDDLHTHFFLNLNYLGTDKEVVHFFKNLRKDVPFDIDSIYLNKLFNEVNEYQRNILHVQWADFRFKYFESPWSFLSALAALILLILTTIQAFFAVHGYLRPPSSG
ncbi:hypothetical protein ACFX2K_040904 [Malus domestica]